jgi:hypothetical protein
MTETKLGKRNDKVSLYWVPTEAAEYLVGGSKHESINNVRQASSATIELPIAGNGLNQCLSGFRIEGSQEAISKARSMFRKLEGNILALIPTIPLLTSS